jgi:hypothetical protein
MEGLSGYGSGDDDEMPQAASPPKPTKVQTASASAAAPGPAADAPAPVSSAESKKRKQSAKDDRPTDGQPQKKKAKKLPSAAAMLSKIPVSLFHHLFGQTVHLIGRRSPAVSSLACVRSIR